MRLFSKSIDGTMELDTKRPGTMFKPLSLFALLIALWAMNLFPIQRAEKVLTATALVSSPRFATLQSLSRASQLDSDSIRWVYYQRESKLISHPSVGKGHEYILLRVGVRASATAERVQSELERLTQASEHTPANQHEQIALRAERWRLATLEHQMGLFELDRMREKHAQLAGLPEDLHQEAGQDLAADHSVAQDQAVGSLQSPTKGRTVTHRKLGVDMPVVAHLGSESQSASQPADSSANQKTWDWLQSAAQECKRRIGGIQLSIEQSKQQSLGTIALSGAPRIEVLSSKASFSHAICVVAFAMLSCIALMLFIKDPATQRPIETARRTLSQTLDGLGIPSLGVISIVQSCDSQEASIGSPTTKVRTKYLRSRATVIGRLSDGLLIAWVSVFILRFLVDSNWRELLFSAPLSAFSSMVIGV